MRINISADGVARSVDKPSELFALGRQFAVVRQLDFGVVFYVVIAILFYAPIIPAFAYFEISAVYFDMHRFIFENGMEHCYVRYRRRPRFFVGEIFPFFRIWVHFFPMAKHLVRSRRVVLCYTVFIVCFITCHSEKGAVIRISAVSVRYMIAKMRYLGSIRLGKRECVNFRIFYFGIFYAVAIFNTNVAVVNVHCLRFTVGFIFIDFQRLFPAKEIHVFGF